jgi:hypothetical protein
VSVLTKIFVVMLVVLSLLLSAATITFVNSIDDYKRVVDAASQGKLSAEASAAEARSQADLAAKQAADAQAQLAAQNQNASQENQRLAKDLADLGVQLAGAKSQATIAEANVSKLTSAVSALQTMSAAAAQMVADLRATNDRLTQQNGELNIALTDSTNKLNITEDARRNLAEQLTERSATVDKLGGALRDLGKDPNRVTSSGLAAGAPAINGVIRDTRQIAGIPHAKISVGSDDAVKVGMEFNILDRTNGKFLGKLTVVAVEPNEAVGRVTGPDIAAIAAGAEVRTQL